ncbi:MAG: LytR C-terminal domain-containing protein [Solirubrobacterales bacterium]
MGELKDILVNVGAIAGVAGIVGLAVLAMLYFSQARDVRRLRDWAGREPERAAEVDLRAQQIASQAIAQAYESMTMRQSEAQAAASIAQEHGVDAGLVVQDPGVEEEHHDPIVEGMEGAPEHHEAADGEAADGVPLEADRPAEFVEGEPAPEPIVAGMEGASGEYPVIEEPLPAGTNGSGAPGDTMISPPPFTPIETGAQQSEVPAELAASASAAPPTDAPVAPGQTGEVRPSRLAPSTPAATRGGGPLPPLPPLGTSEFQAVTRPPLPSVPADYYQSLENTGAGYYDTIDRPAEDRPSRTPFVIAGMLVAVFAVFLLATQLSGEEEPAADNDARQARAQRDARTPSTGKRNPQINRPAVVVSVLNGTEISGLAKIVNDQLVQSDFTQVTTGNRNDNVNHVESVVYYAAGSKLEAEEVAQELGIKKVQEVDPDTAAAGGSAPVIVVLGTDIEQ